MALFATNPEFININDAIADAKSKNVDFIVEFLPDGEKKILSWNYEVQHRAVLEQRYLFDGDKRTILKASTDEQWLVLGKGQAFETILPISEVRHFEKIDA
jgi:hypothetical protein